jgi:hypothetical protein
MRPSSALPLPNSKPFYAIASIEGTNASFDAADKEKAIHEFTSRALKGFKILK